ncbi:MAG: S41 family peptidase, partial [Chitinophagaceae bacterium]
MVLSPSKTLLPVLVAGLVLFTACKKDKDVQASTPPPPSPAPTATVSAADKLKDTALLFSRDIYLWYQQIPSSFNARSYPDVSGVMTALRQHSIEPGFSTPVDRWSFAVKQAEWNNVSSGVAGDFGLSVFFFSPNDLRVKSVERASPAGRAGVRRGWRISKINGNSNITTTNSNFIITTVFESPNTSFTFEKPDGSSVDLTLNAAAYQEHPVYFDSVYQTSAGKLGYIVFNSFLGDTTGIYNDLSRVFSKFSAAGVTDVAVDLRYNGGGYVSVQEKLANYLITSGASGNIMMKQQFNDKYTQY